MQQRPGAPVSGMVFLGLMGTTCFWSHAARPWHRRLCWQLISGAARQAEVCREVAGVSTTHRSSPLQKQPGVMQGSASQHCGTLILMGGSHSISTSTAALTPAPSLPCRFPCSAEVAVFRKLRGDGSFRQEPLQLLTLSLLSPRLSHRAVKKTCSFWLPSRLFPSLNSSPEVLPSTWLGSS